MKLRIITMLMLAACLSITAAGCGGKATKEKYAFVTDGQGTASECGSVLWEGIQEVAGANEIETSLCKAAADTEEAYQEAFAKAVEDKASLVIAGGENMETPLYKSASANSKTDYILFGNVSDAEGTEGGTLPANTTEVIFAEHEQGFIAGYAAVCGGLHNLGVIVGEENAGNTRHVSGFVQGVKKAADDLGLESGSVSVVYEFAGSNALTPLRMSEALGLYGNGVSLIYVAGENIVTAVRMAAQSQEQYYATGGVNHTDDSLCLGSVIPIYNQAVRLILRDYAQDDFTGGSTVTYGYSEGCLELKSNFSSLEGFNQEKYDAIVAALMLGTVKPDDAITLSGSAAVSVSRIDPKDAETKSASVSVGSTSPAETAGEAAESGGVSETSESDESDESSDESDESDESNEEDEEE